MRRLFLAPLVPMLALAIGCGDSFTLAPTDADVTGTFALQTANGHSLPVDAGQTLDGSGEIYQSADVISIAANGTWSETTTLILQSLTDGTEQTQTTNSNGSYSVAHGQINFSRTITGGANFSGSVTGATLTVLFDGSTLVYARE